LEKLFSKVSSLRNLPLWNRDRGNTFSNVSSLLTLLCTVFVKLTFEKSRVVIQETVIREARAIILEGTTSQKSARCSFRYGYHMTLFRYDYHVTITWHSKWRNFAKSQAMSHIKKNVNFAKSQATCMSHVMWKKNLQKKMKSSFANGDLRYVMWLYTWL